MAHRMIAGMAGTAPAPMGKMQCLVLPQWGTPQSQWCLKIGVKVLPNYSQVFKHQNTFCWEAGIDKTDGSKD